MLLQGHLHSLKRRRCLCSSRPATQLRLTNQRCAERPSQKHGGDRRMSHPLSVSRRTECGRELFLWEKIITYVFEFSAVLQGLLWTLAFCWLLLPSKLGLRFWRLSPFSPLKCLDVSFSGLLHTWFGLLPCRNMRSVMSWSPRALCRMRTRLWV